MPVGRMFLKHHYCPDCNINWTDTWECLCDDNCPQCDTPTGPIGWEDVATTALDVVKAFVKAYCPPDGSSVRWEELNEVYQQALEVLNEVD